MLGILLIVWRKFPYLKKLPIDAEQKMVGSFFSDFFPELQQSFKKLDWVSYQGYLLREFEKFLRRLKVVSLKLEGWANSLIKKIKSNTPEVKNTKEAISQAVKVVTGPVKVFPVEPPVNYKKEEQSLIIEIAKDPKNAELYRRLGDIYIAMKNFVDAQESLKTALKLDPDDDKTKDKLARTETMLPM